jgi:phosphoribosylcarboxyaminoimidazole (NCAIR) mutase
VTFTVKLNVPEEVGMPEIAPVEAVKVNPAGNAPALMLQLYGIVPPLAAKVVE